MAAMAGEKSKYSDVIRQRRLSVLFLVAIVAALILFSQGTGSEAVYVEAQDEALLLQAGEEELTIPYEDISGVTLTDHWETGSLVNGEETANARSGVWSNDGAGLYALFALTDIDHVIVLETEGTTLQISGLPKAQDQDLFLGTAVFNYESEETTDSIFDALEQLMIQKGLSDQVAFTRDLTESEE